MSRKLLALPLILGLLACPYAADAPLSERRDEVDERLVGAWRCASDTDADDAVGKISFSGPREGSSEAVIEAPGETAERMPTFITTVGQQRILNVRDSDRQPVKWHFVRYSFAGARLRLEIAEAEAFKSRLSPREVIAAAEGKGGVFVPMLTCTRVP